MYKKVFGVFQCDDGERFDTEDQVKEWELLKLIHKNLYKHVKDRFFPDQRRKVFIFLVEEKQSLLLLLTNGNLETVYQGRVLK